MENIRNVLHSLRSPTLRAIYRWSKPTYKAILGISVLSILGALLSLEVTLVTKRLIDGATKANVKVLWLNGTAIILLTIIGRLLSILSSYIRTHAAVKQQRYMQGIVTEAILGKDYVYLKSYHSGQLVNRVFSDCMVIQNGVLSFLPSFLGLIVSFIGSVTILVSWDWRFVPVMILAALIGSGLMVAFREPMKQRHKRMQAAEDALHASTQETIENIRVVKASLSEERVLNQMEGDREHLSNEQIRNSKLSIAMNNGMGAIFDLSRLICYIWGCVKIFNNEFTYGSLAAMIQLVGRIQGPIANAMSLVSQMYGVTASAERLQEVIGLPDEAQGTMLTGFDAIRMDGLSFQYEDGVDKVLVDLNGTIKKGDFVALTGISGGGKTSLFQLLLGIYKPTSGSLLFVSGDKIVPAARGTRSLFAYVPQGNTLMSGTLKDNLTMFTDHATDEQIGRAVKAACLEELVAEVGLDARLGERGIGLSEGQAQRVAIARALLSGAPILLLDESTSALDEQTEAELLKNIDAMRDKTVIIVTHRKAALAICDYTLHISDGRMTRIERTKA